MKSFGSFFAAILGIFLFLGSFGLLWWNEGNSTLKCTFASWMKSIQKLLLGKYA